MSRSLLAAGSLLALLVSSLSVPPAAATGSNESGERRRSAASDFPAEAVREYIATVVALGTVPSPFGRFTAIRVEGGPDGASVVFARADGSALQLSFTAPRRCVDCVRGRLFAISWPQDDPDGGTLARAIVDRAVALEVDSARGQLSKTAMGRTVGPLVTLLIRLDAAGVRLREILWHAVASVASVSDRSTAIWQRVWDNLESRGPGLRDAASSLMLMPLWVLAALFVGVEITHAMQRLDRRTRIAILGLVVGSALLRHLLAGHGPGDLHLNLLVEDYGLTPAGLLGLLGAFTPTSPETVVFVATILGSLATGLCCFLSVALRREPATAVAAGVLLSVQPVLIRFSGDCERQSYVLFLAIAALWGLAEYLNSRRWTALAVNIVATLLCLNARPEAVFVLAFSALLVWPGHRLTRASLGGASVVAFAVLAAPLVSTRLRDLIGHVVGSSVPGTAPAGPGTTLWMSWEYTSVVVMALFAAGVVFSLAKRERDGLWAVLSLVVTTLVLRGPVADGWLANARYQTVSLIPFTLLAAVGLAHIGRLAADHWNEKVARAVTAGIWSAILLSTWPPLHRVILPRTIDYEFRFLSRVLPTLPADAVVYCTRDDESDFDMKKFQLVSNLLGLGSQRWLVWEGEPLPADRASYFFVQPYCRVRPDEWQMRHARDISARAADDTPGAFNACREAARCGQANAVAEEVVPARRFSLDEFTESEVVIAMLELSPATCSAAAPHRIAVKEGTGGESATNP